MNIINLAKNIVRNLRFTLKNIPKKAVTINYPVEKREFPERLRLGTFGLTIDEKTGDEACIACKLCERICPSQIIDIEIEKRDGRGWAKSFNLDLQSCIQCELCVQVCPVDAIIMMKTPERPAVLRSDLYLTKSKMLKNALEYEESWAKGSVLQDSHKPTSGEKDA
ncbi:MAG: 4Fe-4S dicluster domain-containing protein [Thermodesulfobacteriota bacterium]|nr:4Fe-4S dicluster domain-containing protein [Thermodesulfobacteriota bacterium]